MSCHRTLENEVDKIYAINSFNFYDQIAEERKIICFPDGGVRLKNSNIGTGQLFMINSWTTTLISRNRHLGS